MSDEDWEVGYARSLCVFINGSFLGVDGRGEQITDDSFLLLFNAHSEPVEFRLPDQRFGRESDSVTAPNCEFKFSNNHDAVENIPDSTVLRTFSLAVDQGPTVRRGSWEHCRIGALVQGDDFRGIVLGDRAPEVIIDGRQCLAAADPLVMVNVIQIGHAR